MTILGQIRKKRRIPLEEGKRIATLIRSDIAPLAERTVLVGSIRRGRPEVADIEFVVLPRDPGEFDRAMREMGFEVGEKRRKYTGAADGVKVEIYVAQRFEELGALILAYTGDFLMNVAMRSKAKRMGYKMDQYGIWKGKRAVLQGPDERDFFEFLGMAWHEPAQRSLAARAELEKLAREIRPAFAVMDPVDVGFVEQAIGMLKREKWLPPHDERKLRSLHARYGSGVRKEGLRGASLGAEELLELGIRVPEDFADGSTEAMDVQGLWQELYDLKSEGEGTVVEVGVFVRGEDEAEIWVDAIEDRGLVRYIAFSDFVPPEELALPVAEFLYGFAVWALESGEAPPWSAPFEPPQEEA